MGPEIKSPGDDGLCRVAPARTACLLRNAGDLESSIFSPG